MAFAIAAKMKASQRAKAASTRRRLCPAAASSALMASPAWPRRKFRSGLPSVFMWPMVASMADRRLSSRRMVAERPRRRDATDGCRLIQCRGEGVAVIGIAGKGLGCQHQPLAVGHRNPDLGAELVGGTGLSLGD